MTDFLFSQDLFRRKNVVNAFLAKEFPFLEEYLPLITTDRINDIYLHLPPGNVAESLYQNEVPIEKYVAVNSTSVEAVEKRIQKSVSIIAKDLEDIINISEQRGSNALLKRSYCLTRTIQKDNPDYLRLYFLGVDSLPVLWKCLDTCSIISDQITEKVIFRLKQIDTSMMNYQQISQLIRAIYANVDYQSFAKPEYSASRMQMLVELQLQGHSVRPYVSKNIPLSTLVKLVYDNVSPNPNCKYVENYAAVKKRRKTMSDTVANFYPYNSFENDPFAKMNKEHSEYIKGYPMTC